MSYISLKSYWRRGIVVARWRIKENSMRARFWLSARSTRLLLALVTSLVIIAVAGGSGAAAVGRSGGGATSVSIRLDFFASPHHAGFYVAKAKGWYSRAGLNVSINEGT